MLRSIIDIIFYLAVVPQEDKKSIDNGMKFVRYRGEDEEKGKKKVV